MTNEKLTWVDATTLTTEGKGFSDAPDPFGRLPACAEATVLATVWDLARNSAGVAVRFVTDAVSLSAKWKLLGKDLAMDHMPASGVSGLDLYVREAGGWRWLGLGRADKPGWVQEADLKGGMSPDRRELMLYLPLYNGIETLQIGVPAGATLEAASPRTDKPVVIYGTSIVQGACASRPGMAYPAILGRKLDRPMINLGFCGNGRSEPELAELLAEIDASAYVLDALPNMTAEGIAELIEPFVSILRAARPDVPIVLIESIEYQDRAHVPARMDRNITSNAALAGAYQRMLDAGVTGLHYVAGDPLLGGDGEGTIDGTHATDLGFMRIAEALEPVLRPLLKVDPNEEAKESCT